MGALIEQHAADAESWTVGRRRSRNLTGDGSSYLSTNAIRVKHDLALNRVIDY